MIAYTHVNLIAALQAENAALKEQVAQLEKENWIQHQLTMGLQSKLTTLQSKSAALVDALNSIWTLCDGNAAKWAEEVLVAFKGEK